jgi:hypothetical protein
MVWHNAPGLDAIGHAGHTSLLVRRNVKTGPWYMEMTPNAIFPFDYQPDYINSNERYISFWPAPEDRANPKRAFFLRHHLQDYYNELGERTRQLLTWCDNRTVDNTRWDPAWEYYEQHGQNWPAPRLDQIVIGTSGRQLDDIWGKEPDAQISLQGLSPTRGFALGLNLNKVVGFAAEFKGTPACDYHFVSRKQNCAGVAVRALVAGGADAFSKLWADPSKGILYITPNDAEEYVKSVKIGIERCNNMLDHLRQWAQVGMLMLGGDLPQLDEWKRMSAVDWKMRGTLLRNIDTALTNYHRLTWQLNFPDKLVELVTIIRNTYDHCQRSRTKARDNGFKALVPKILNVVGQQALDAGTPWTTNDYYGEELGASNKDNKIKK